MRKILFALGSTGGHIFPAISILESIEESSQKVQVKLVASSRSKIKLPKLKNNNQVYKINTVGFVGKSILFKVKSIFILLSSVVDSIKIIRNFKPEIIVGTGGFIFLPIALAGFILRKKIYIVEGNSVPGLSNKIISKFSNKTFINFNVTKKYFNEKKCISSGFPIRKLMVKRMESKPIDILILGGSQGSKLLNKKFKDSLRLLLNKIKDSFDQRSEFTIVHQCGLNNDVQLEDFYNQIRREFPFFKFELHEFINNIDEYYHRTKVLISRAGASTIAESIYFKIPTIYIPIEKSSGNHQLLNAKEISDKKLAFLHREHETIESLIIRIYNLLYDDKIRNNIYTKLEENQSLSNQNSAQIIADGILQDV